jgi:hypothetical protein
MRKLSTSAPEIAKAALRDLSFEQWPIHIYSGEDTSNIANVFLAAALAQKF